MAQFNRLDVADDVAAMPSIRLAVIGAGLVGERHAKLAASHPDFSLVAIVDPNPDRQKLADQLECDLIPSIDNLSSKACDAAIVATPNGDHLTTGMKCVERSWPCLIEKPIADTIANGEKLYEAFSRANIPLLIGHHRRYHPVVSEAHHMIAERTLGDPVMASIVWAVRKPDSYFHQGAWRSNEEGGPLLINFIHEADLMLCILGPVREVQALTSSHQRGGHVEDTAGVLLRFESGLIATVTLSDAALSPWSFEGATGENPNIAETGISSWRIGCTQGAFEFPNMQTWRDRDGGEGDWSRPLRMNAKEARKIDPLYEQLSHFAALIRRKAQSPFVSGADGLNALRLVQAIQQAAKPPNRFF